MIELNEITLKDMSVIEGYGAGFFRVNGALYHGDILILPHRVQSWDAQKAGMIFAEIANDVDFLLYGTGGQMALPCAALQQAAQDATLRLEMMSTLSACRTYNILLAEGRRVGALLHALEAGDGDTSAHGAREGATPC